MGTPSARANAHQRRHGRVGATAFDVLQVLRIDTSEGSGGLLAEPLGFAKGSDPASQTAQDTFDLPARSGC